MLCREVIRNLQYATFIALSWLKAAVLLGNHEKVGIEPNSPGMVEYMFYSVFLKQSTYFAQKNL